MFGAIIKAVNERIFLYHLKKSGKVLIGKHVGIKNILLGENVNIAHHAEVANVILGKRTSVGRYTKIQNAVVGKYCSISWNVTIGALEHPLSSISTHSFPYRKKFNLCKNDRNISHQKVKIDNDVWIGCGAIVMPGVHIGNGAVIGAGAIVTHDVPPYQIVAGVPARCIKNRFSETIVSVLNELQWWNLSDDILRDNLELFSDSVNLNKDIKNLNKLVDICNEYSKINEKDEKYYGDGSFEDF